MKEFVFVSRSAKAHLTQAICGNNSTDMQTSQQRISQIFSDVLKLLISADVVHIVDKNRFSPRCGFE